MKKYFASKAWNHKTQKFSPVSFEVSSGKFSKLEWKKPEGLSSKHKYIDLGEGLMGPSGVDLHVHSRDFEESHKETFESLEVQALKGGVSTLVCMANTFPRLDSAEMIQKFLNRVKNKKVRMIPFAAATKNIEGKEPTDWRSLLKLPVAGLSDDGKPITDEAIMLNAMKACQREKKLISLHEEDLRLSHKSLMHLSDVSLRRGLEGSPAASEVLMVKRDLALAKKTGAHLHFGHLSSRESVKLLKQARREQISFSAELTPHHGLLSVEDSESLEWKDLGKFKVCPVIREAADRSALQEGLGSGVIDCLASDHAPHSHLEKNQTYSDCVHGMISLENSLPLYLEVMARSKLSWARFFSAWAVRPAQLLSGVLTAGTGVIAEGAPANFVVFDQRLEVLKWQHGRSRNTPFRNFQVRGRVLKHYLGGDCVHSIE